MEVMDYENKYKEALGFIEKVYRCSNDPDEKKRIEKIFPGLAGSESERIKTFLHHTFTAQYLCKDKLGKWHGEPVVNILAWLEKQGEQKPISIDLKNVDEEFNSILKDKVSFETVKLLLENWWKNVRTIIKQQKPADKVEPKFKIGDIVKRKDNPHLTYTLKRFTDDGDYEFHAIGKDGNEGCTHFAAVKCQDDWEFVEQNPAEWSEEDENQRINTIELVKNANDCAGILDKETALNWLKSLKDRVQPQPKQEWSEEDEEMFNSIKFHLDSDRAEINCYSWFDELKERIISQPKWKPSEKQIKRYGILFQKT